MMLTHLPTYIVVWCGSRRVYRIGYQDGTQSYDPSIGEIHPQLCCNGSPMDGDRDGLPCHAIHWMINEGAGWRSCQVHKNGRIEGWAWASWWAVESWILWTSVNSTGVLILVLGCANLQSKDDSSCFDDYSTLAPMTHDFILSNDDQQQFLDL